MVALQFLVPAIIIPLTVVNHILVGSSLSVITHNTLSVIHYAHKSCICTVLGENTQRENELFTVIYLILLRRDIIS